LTEISAMLCSCGTDIFRIRDGEAVNDYEDLTGKVQHTKFDCEINKVVSKRIRKLEIEIEKIKGFVNL